MWHVVIQFFTGLFGGRDDHSIPAETSAQQVDPDEEEHADVVEARPDEVTPYEPISVTVDRVVFAPPVVAATSGAVSEPAAAPSSDAGHGGIRTVGAWCGSRSLKNPDQDVDFAVATGINRLDIIVNDHSTWRGPSTFTMRDEGRILRLAEKASKAGIEVHFMSWVMPHEEYLREAVPRLTSLAACAGVKSIQWDAEEPWTKAKKPMDYRRAAELIKELRDESNTGCLMGVNGIGYASVAKLGPLAEVCDYIVPQAYSTSSSGIDPKTGPEHFYKRWKQHFKKPVVMGLAAYRQTGIAGYTDVQAMQAAIDSTRKIAEVDTVIYWSLTHIRQSRNVARVISKIVVTPDAVS